MHLPLKARLRQMIQNEQIRKGRRLFRVTVHDPRGPGIQIGQFKALIAFLGIHLTELGELLPGHEQIHIVIPGNKAMVPHSTQQAAAHQVIRDLMPVADLYNVPQLAKQLLMNLLQRQFAFFHG